MSTATTDLPELPAVMDSAEVARALRQDLGSIQRQLRGGLLPGIKLPGGRWRVKREDVLAILAGQSPARAARAERLGGDTMRWLAELAAEAPALTDAQKDVIRGAFRETTIQD